MGLRRLYFDIETSPCIGWFWRPGYNLNLSYDNIIENAKIICISYKWADSDKFYSLSWDAKQNDKSMLKKFIRILDQADEIIGHNSDRFDIKWIRTRCLYHKIPMMPDYVSLDTLKASRRGFNFPSNKLDSIGKYLGIGKKLRTRDGLWNDVCIKNSRSALKEMVIYCNQDVALLEDIFNRLNPYIKGKAVIERDYLCNCPNCGSSDVISNGTRYSASGNKVARIVCHKCHKYYTMPHAKFHKERGRMLNDARNA